MAKYYAVAKGKSGSPCIYESWDECKKNVIGFKGAIYKSFTSKEEALNFLKLHGSNLEDSALDSEDKSVDKKNESVNEKDILKIYVDGSFKVEKNNYSYGLIAVVNDEPVYEDCGVGEDPEAVLLRNVSGEVLGSMKAVEYAIKCGYKTFNLYFDYQGIESWALGTWKRNNRITQNYNKFMQEKMKEISINFVKVKGHSGDKYNDIADKLAKSVL